MALRVHQAVYDFLCGPPGGPFFTPRLPDPPVRAVGLGLLHMLTLPAQNAIKIRKRTLDSCSKPAVHGHTDTESTPSEQKPAEDRSKNTQRKIVYEELKAKKEFGPCALCKRGKEKDGAAMSVSNRHIPLSPA